MTKKNRYFDFKSQASYSTKSGNKHNVLQRSLQPGLADGLFRTPSIALVADDKKNQKFRAVNQSLINTERTVVLHP